VGGIVTSDATAVLTSGCGWDWGWGIGIPAEGGGACVEPSDRAERINIDGGKPPCSDAKDLAVCNPARALASANARCDAAVDEADDVVLRVRAAATSPL
jgi:hypothetical protein